jgi:phage-related baseplate assembly protein
MIPPASMKETHNHSLTASLKVSPAEDLDCSSSDESESEVIAPTQDASQRRLIQKARFEALSVTGARCAYYLRANTLLASLILLLPTTRKSKLPMSPKYPQLS